MSEEVYILKQLQNSAMPSKEIRLRIKYLILFEDLKMKNIFKFSNQITIGRKSYKQ